ncbi:hypothetical protein KGF57_000847 [Candida theae]|uniref:Uncharacterized protein n=1 Tax=Candida theae TaxID=1198502 RepID=A0AAD5G0F9_9ASCO|nr:uncharacterized protein KGF57_000847 [Candida theae]KAI5965054.1 hypothetical protein KGF57_000847 [Candida theae]
MPAFKQVDVFTSKRFKGNPLAVIMDASGLSSDQMQNIANWTNLSETTFVLPPTTDRADYRVRIFTPQSELPFAGHPTIGTAHALLESGLISAKDGSIVQECGAGLVNLTIANSGSISFELPRPTITPLEEKDIDSLEGALGCKIDRNLRPSLVDVGARWIIAHIVDAEAVLSIEPKLPELVKHNKQLKATGVTVYGEWSKDHIEVRSFAPACGVDEDPVCGSGNGAVAAFIKSHGVLDRAFESSQGKMVRREGELKLTISEEKILVGGNAITCIEGTLNAGQ